MQYNNRLLLRCIHHFKSDLINNMDHMHVSGNKHSSVILSQTSLTAFESTKISGFKMIKVVFCVFLHLPFWLHSILKLFWRHMPRFYHTSSGKGSIMRVRCQNNKYTFQQNILFVNGIYLVSVIAGLPSAPPSPHRGL